MLDLILLIIVLVIFSIYLIIVISENVEYSFNKKLFYIILIIIFPVIGTFYVAIKIESKNDKKKNKDNDDSSSSSLTADDKYNPNYEGIDIELGD